MIPSAAPSTSNYARDTIGRGASNYKQQENGCSIRQSQCVNQGGQSSRLISTTWIVKKIACDQHRKTQAKGCLVQGRFWTEFERMSLESPESNRLRYDSTRAAGFMS
jgi:hypothetical protein